METNSTIGPEVDWKQVTEQFNALEAGDLCKGNDGAYYIKPQQSRSHHLDGMLISLLSGKITHFSNTYGLQPVAWHEIVW